MVWRIRVQAPNLASSTQHALRSRTRLPRLPICVGCAPGQWMLRLWRARRVRLSKRRSKPMATVRNQARSPRLLTCALAVWGIGVLAGPMPAFPAEQTAITAGDLLYIDVYRRPELSATTQVDPMGNVSLPYIGQVAVAGLTEETASARVSAALTKILKNPRATVSRTAAPVSVGARTPEMHTKVIALENTKAEALYDALVGMSSAGGSIGFDPHTNTLIITDTPEAVANMLDVVDQLDHMQTQVTQVRIEAKIAEVKKGAMKELGIRWFAQGTEVGGGFYPPIAQQPGIAGITGENSALANETVRGNSGGVYGSGASREFVNNNAFDRRFNIPVHVPTSGQLFFGLLNEHVDLGAMLDALVADDKAETLASPMILAVNHQTAVIKMT
ncbi:MAG TPA: hypothetical protein ENN80_05930, partial [Candidatus Hydrogenedentes bacterium]|nr:hypothetical protein [Candidatus Hydrogenedentota bacterium]